MAPYSGRHYRVSLIARTCRIRRRPSTTTTYVVSGRGLEPVTRPTLAVSLPLRIWHRQASPVPLPPLEDFRHNPCATKYPATMIDLYITPVTGPTPSPVHPAQTT